MATTLSSNATGLALCEGHAAIFRQLGQVELRQLIKVSSFSPIHLFLWLCTIPYTIALHSAWQSAQYRAQHANGADSFPHANQLLSVLLADSRALALHTPARCVPMVRCGPQSMVRAGRLPQGKDGSLYLAPYRSNPERPCEQLSTPYCTCAHRLLPRLLRLSHICSPATSVPRPRRPGTQRSAASKQPCRTTKRT